MSLQNELRPFELLFSLFENLVHVRACVCAFALVAGIAGVRSMFMGFLGPSRGRGRHAVT